MARQYKIGDKVIPITKSVYCSLEKCEQWEKAKEVGQNYLTVWFTPTNNNYLELAYEEGSGLSTYAVEDVIPYVDLRANDVELVDTIIVSGETLQSMINAGIIMKNEQYEIRRA